MPAKSEAQRRWAFGRMGARWAKKHHFDNPGKLPRRVQKPTGKRAKFAKARKRKRT